MPKRILFLNHNKKDAGTYFRCLQLARQLARKGNVRVEIVCAAKSDWTLRTESVEVARGVTVTTTPHLPGELGYLGILLRGIWVAARLLLRAPRPDYVHAFALAWPSVAIPALVARWLLRLPVAADWDDLWGGGYASFLPRVVDRAVTEAEERLPGLLRADFMTVVSAELGERARERASVSAGLVHLVRNGCDPGVEPRDRGACRRRLGVAPDAPIVVSIGHTYTPGSLRHLLDAARPLREGFPDLRVVLVGDFAKRGRFGREIENVLAASGLGEALVVTGEVSRDTMLDWVGAASALALPMEDSAIDRCRSPIRLGDYLASGGTIVSDAVGEVRAVLEGRAAGLLSSSGDIAAFTRNLERALASADLRDSLGERARHVALYEETWAHGAFELARCYSRHWGIPIEVELPVPARKLEVRGGEPAFVTA